MADAENSNVVAEYDDVRRIFYNPLYFFLIMISTAIPFEYSLMHIQLYVMEWRLKGREYEILMSEWTVDSVLIFVAGCHHMFIANTPETGTWNKDVWKTDVSALFLSHVVDVFIAIMLCRRLRRIFSTVVLGKKINGAILGDFFECCLAVIIFGTFVSVGVRDPGLLLVTKILWLYILRRVKDIFYFAVKRYPLQGCFKLFLTSVTVGHLWSWTNIVLFTLPTYINALRTDMAVEMFGDICFSLSSLLTGYLVALLFADMPFMCDWPLLIALVYSETVCVDCHEVLVDRNPPCRCEVFDPLSALRYFISGEQMPIPTPKSNEANPKKQGDKQKPKQFCSRNKGGPK